MVVVSWGLWLASRSSVQLGCCVVVLLAEGWQVILCIASVCLVTARLELVLKDGSFSCYSAANSFVALRPDVLHIAARCFALPWQIGRNVPIVGLLVRWVSSCFGWWSGLI